MCSTQTVAQESLMKNHSNIPTGTEKCVCSGPLDSVSATLLSLMVCFFFFVFFYIFICCDVPVILFNHSLRDLFYICIGVTRTVLDHGYFSDSVISL